MTAIDKSSLVTQLQALIDGLNVSTETTENLSSILRSAQAIGADASSIVTQLNSLIAAVTTSTAVDQVSLLAVSLLLLTEDREVSVATTGDLPSTAAPGTVYWVDSEGLPYIRRISGTWTVIDPSLQPVALENAWAWGSNSAGRLGDGTIISTSSPVSVVGGFTDWTAISAGAGHTAAVRANGSAWAWGFNSFGRLGDGTVTSRLSPVSVVGGFADWTDISAGSYHTAALRANGSAWAWGYNSYGQLGDGTTNTTSSPVSVVGGFTDWTDISAGRRNTAALRANGTAWAWGRNLDGRLGDGTATTRLSPVSVVGGFTDWTDISAGQLHTAAVRANGGAWTWGRNSEGQVGDGTITNRSSPVSVIGGFTDWTDISADNNQTAAVRANGTAWAWGYNAFGQLGDNTTANRSSPVSVVGGFVDWSSISAGGDHTAALRANGTAWAWGRNGLGRLGDNTVTNRSSPVSVVGGFVDWTDISAGGIHTAAIRTA